MYQDEPMKLSTEDIAKALGVSPINTNANLSLNNISIDSRDPQKDNIFIAIKGEHHNGHDFIDDAFEKGPLSSNFCVMLRF